MQKRCSDSTTYILSDQEMRKAVSDFITKTDPRLRPGFLQISAVSDGWEAKDQQDFQEVQI